MPFDGTTQELVASAEALMKLITFFENEANWYQDDYCRRRGRHSYPGGRMCLSGALARVCDEGAPNDVYRYVRQAIARRRPGRHETISAFNLSSNHSLLMAVLHEARALALIAMPPIATPQKQPSYVPKVEARPTPEDASVEVLLLDDLMSFFESQESERDQAPGGSRLSQALYYFRKTRVVRGDKTSAYLRLAFRRVPWTFGGVRAFDARASREELLAVLHYARYLALDDADKRAAVAKREELKVAA